LIKKEISLRLPLFYDFYGEKISRFDDLEFPKMTKKREI